MLESRVLGVLTGNIAAAVLSVEKEILLGAYSGGDGVWVEGCLKAKVQDYTTGVM